MDKGFRLFPEQASTYAGQVDALYFFLVGVTIFFSTLIFILIYIFAVKYRRRSEDEIPKQIPGLIKLELIWSIIPFCITMVMFVWGAKLYFKAYTPPEEALEIYVVGKQWMWHIQHPTGQREINELHVPADQPVKLTMATEDVIHSFYIPAFRIKKDVVPGRYSSIWFEANKRGKYHLFCAEYCGTKHSAMVGWVTVMEPAEYQNWLSGGSGAEPPAVTGEKKFQKIGCITCHSGKPGAQAPSLQGVFGDMVQLYSGAKIIANQDYIRESILKPNEKTVAGFEKVPRMPTYQGQLSEADILQLIAYIKSIGKQEGNL